MPIIVERVLLGNRPFVVHARGFARSTHPSLANHRTASAALHDSFATSECLLIWSLNVQDVSHVRNECYWPYFEMIRHQRASPDAFSLEKNLPISPVFG